MDFTEIKPGKFGYRYLLVFVDTFSGWTEAFPTKKETALVVAKKLLDEIIPRYGLPTVIGSDNGPAFISQVIQGLGKILGTSWKLHCAYQPQSSGQVERMNQTLKETLTKLTWETGGDWVALLPFALLRARNTPYLQGLTPYEIMFGRPPPLCPRLKADLLAEVTNQDVLKSLQALQRDQDRLFPLIQHIHSLPPVDPHPFQPGDPVWVKRHHKETPEPR